jgi:hypothetical protein
MVESKARDFGLMPRDKKAALHKVGKMAPLIGCKMHRARCVAPTHRALLADNLIPEVLCIVWQ